MKNTSLVQAVAIGAAALALAACDRATVEADAQRAGAKLDRAIDRTQEKLAAAGEKTQQALDETGDQLKPKLAAAGDRIAAAGNKVAGEVKEAVRADGAPDTSRNSVGAAPAGSRTVTTTVTTGERTTVGGLPEGTRAAVNDAAITTAVKAGFLRDPGLSVLKIDVDTKEGVVVLNGVADDGGAKERATQIAGGVKGVREVRNHLSVKQG